jgi:hypothetical protein
VERKNHDLSESNLEREILLLYTSFSTPPPPSPEETQKFEWSSGTKKTDSSKASQSYSIPYVTSYRASPDLPNIK